MEVVSRMGRKVWLLDQQSKKWSIKGVIKSIRIDGRSYVDKRILKRFTLLNQFLMKQEIRF